MALTPVIPSGTTDGMPVKVAQAATAGTLFHTCSATASVIDSVTLWLCNTSVTDVLATIELGDATAPDHNVKITVPANDLVIALAGHRMQNSKTVRVFAATINVINMFGNVDRYTP